MMSIRCSMRLIGGVCGRRVMCSVVRTFWCVFIYCLFVLLLIFIVLFVCFVINHTTFVCLNLINCLLQFNSILFVYNKKSKK